MFAILVVTVPFTLILKILLGLPKAFALSHRRWPLSLNFTLIGVITLYLTIFIRSAYFARGSEPLALVLQFLIAALAYVFGLVLLLRQFAGVYPEYMVTTGPTGLSIRKTVYRKITDVQEVSRSRDETTLRIQTTTGFLYLALPTRDVSLLIDQIRR
jgi:hypothetical protein